MAGWLPSLIVYAVAENSIATYGKGYFLKALSVLQRRPSTIANPTELEQMCGPLIQMFFWYTDQGCNYRLRYHG